LAASAVAIPVEEVHRVAGKNESLSKLDKLDKLVEKLREALGADLVSVILYGSAAAGDHDENFSDYNVLCVLTEMAPKHLEASETVFRWWREQGNPAPLLLTRHEVETSTDCFAIEFRDIKDHHRILFGADVVSALEIDWSFYRAQVERELRAKFLRVRQKASGILSDKDALRRLLADSLSTFCVLFRHALMLHGTESPARKRDIIARARERFEIDAAPFLTLLDLREERVKPKDVDPDVLLAPYMKQIEKVIDAVDRLEK
jgi:predicted nucleotidyltransferase